MAFSNTIPQSSLINLDIIMLNFKFNNNNGHLKCFPYFDAQRYAGMCYISDQEQLSSWMAHHFPLGTTKILVPLSLVCGLGAVFFFVGFPRIMNFQEYVIVIVPGIYGSEYQGCNPRTLFVYYTHTSPIIYISHLIGPLLLLL